MQIAIVDDSPEDRLQIKKAIEDYFIHHHSITIDVKFIEFICGEEFVQDFVPNRFAIIFLDIYMKELTGVEVSKKIYALDKRCQLIFLTSSTDHLLDGYEVHAAGYVVKPLCSNKGTLYRTLDYCLEKLNLDQAQIEFSTKNLTIKIFLRDILYIDAMKRHYVSFHLRHTTVDAIGSYDEYAAFLLKDQRILECYHKIIVNMDFIATIKEDDFILKNDEIIPISRRKKLEVKRTYMLYFIAK